MPARSYPELLHRLSTGFSTRRFRRTADADVANLLQPSEGGQLLDHPKAVKLPNADTVKAIGLSSRPLRQSATLMPPSMTIIWPVM